MSLGAQHYMSKVFFAVGMISFMLTVVLLGAFCAWMIVLWLIDMAGVKLGLDLGIRIIFLNVYFLLGLVSLTSIALLSSCLAAIRLEQARRLLAVVGSFALVIGFLLIRLGVIR